MKLINKWTIGLLVVTCIAALIIFIIITYKASH